MVAEQNIVSQITNENCCCLSSSNHCSVHSIQSQENSNPHQLIDENRLRKQVEDCIFVKLEEYSNKNLIDRLRLKSISQIRRLLKRDIRTLYKQWNSDIVSEEKLYQWIDETLEQMELHISQLRSLVQSQGGSECWFITNNIFSSNNVNNEWKVLQLQQAKTLSLNDENDDDEELLARYRQYVVEKLTPEKLEHNKVSLENQERIHLDEEYKKVVVFGQEYLRKMLDNYKQRQHPNFELVQEIIHLGMKKMIKRPGPDEFRQASASSNIFMKAKFIQKSRRSYHMSLQNLADDFKFLRFEHSLDENPTDKTISDRFIVLIHKFLNTISLLSYLFKSKSSGASLSVSLFGAFGVDLSNENILSPSIYIDEWTWLLEKWKMALETFPINLTNNGAFGRLVRTTIGVGIARLYGFVINNEQDENDRKLFHALQLGFYYGITYALVDGLQDSQTHQENPIDIDKWLEKAEHVLCGDQFDPSSVPQLPISSLLLEAFHSIAHLTSIDSTTQQVFTDLALLLRSQRSDKKDLENSNYNDVDVFLGTLLKSHFTYTITAILGGTKLSPQLGKLWITPFLGQLTDDCRDFNEDIHAKSITPVTYYVQHNGLSFNPFFVFLFVCEDLYLKSNHESNMGAFLGRRIIRTLRALGGDFKKFIKIFTETSYPKLYRYVLSLEHLFCHVSDPEKAVFRHVNTFAKTYAINHRRLETFAYDCLPTIEKQLLINTYDNDSLIHGMNHSLKAGGKRLRPLFLIMVAQLYNISIQRILPLARALEYLHTSSLVFDDLPAQDNAPIRRGQPTLHRTIDSDSNNNIPSSLTEGRAQLAAINLIAYAIQSVAIGLSQENFSHERINQVIDEISKSMSQLCHGQFLDLLYSRTKKQVALNELDEIACLKTGKAIEIAIICPIILTGQEQSLDRFRELSGLLGILFQMKDDLLDVEGHTSEIGKLSKIDQQNKTATYINLLGIEETRNRIVSIRKFVEYIVNDLWPQAGTIRSLIRYICEREK